MSGSIYTQGLPAQGFTPTPYPPATFAPEHSQQPPLPQRVSLQGQPPNQQHLHTHQPPSLQRQQQLQQQRQHPPQLQQQQDQHQQQQQQAPQYLHGALHSGDVGTATNMTTITTSQQATAAPPSRTRFSFFRRRGPMPAPTAQPPLPQQTQQQAFPPPAGRPAPPPPAAAHHGAPPPPPPLPRDAQPMQELMGGNWIFVVFVPYFVATALQDTHLQIGLIVATVVSVVVLLLGLLVFALNMRKVFPHILEVLMPIIFAVQLGVSYHSTSYKQEIIRTYPFITHSALAGLCLASLLVCYPVGYQTAQELVHKMYMTNPAVHRVGLYTTAVLTASLVTSCLLYLAPLCKGYDNQHFSALNLVFRLIYPPLATALALLFVRFFPDIYLPNMAVVHGLNRRPKEDVAVYLVDVMARRPPAILDASMFQSTVDALTKAREATIMRRASPYASLTAPQHQHHHSPLTPRYTPGGGSLGGAAPHGHEPLPGKQLAPGYGMMDGGYGDVVPGMLSGGMEPRPVHTYYAAEPPTEPPLAVYAVYGNYNALPLYGQQPPRVQPLTYGGSAHLMPYGKEAAPGYAAAAPRSRYMHGSAGGAAGAYGARAPPYRSEEPLYPGLKHVSASGTGPYGVNMPLQAIAGDAPGQLPPYRQPDAVVTGVAAAAPPPVSGRYHPPEVLDSGVGAYRRSQPHPQPQPLQRPGTPEYYGSGVQHTPAPPSGPLYGGSVSLMPPADPYGAEYGLGAEVLQQDAGVPPPPPPAARFGLYVDTAAAVQAVYNSPAGLQGGGVPNPASSVDAYGLQAETAAAVPPPLLRPQRAPSRTASPVRPPSPCRPPSPLAGGESFGLDAEVGAPPPPPPDARRPPYRTPPSYMSPSPQGISGRREAAVPPPPPGSGGGFGLDAEVGM